MIIFNKRRFLVCICLFIYLQRSRWSLLGLRRLKRGQTGMLCMCLSLLLWTRSTQSSLQCYRMLWEFRAARCCEIFFPGTHPDLQTTGCELTTPAWEASDHTNDISPWKITLLEKVKGEEKCSMGCNKTSCFTGLGCLIRPFQWTSVCSPGLPRQQPCEVNELWTVALKPPSL